LTAVAAGVAPSAVMAQTCGAVITQSTVLHANIGPCPGSGLIVPDGARNITLDLNGFTITGSNAPGSAGIHVLGALVFINGPGTVVNFENGVLLQRYAPQKVTVQDLRLRDNRWGINMLSTWNVMAGENRILRNHISGRGEVGIRNDASLFALIAWNIVSGQSVAGIALYNGHGGVTEANVVRGNKVGIHLNGYSEPSLVRNNDVSDNELDGIAGSSQMTISDNNISRNGRDGIAVAGPSELNVLISGNRVMHNARRGIAVGSMDGSPAEPVSRVGAGSVRVVNNFVRQNHVVDLFWFGGGPYVCWSDNKSGGSIPGVLPACQ
jgi:hypothetical protein